MPWGAYESSTDCLPLGPKEAREAARDYREVEFGRALVGGSALEVECWVRSAVYFVDGLLLLVEEARFAAARQTRQCFRRVCGGL